MSEVMKKSPLDYENLSKSDLCDLISARDLEIRRLREDLQKSNDELNKTKTELSDWKDGRWKTWLDEDRDIRREIEKAVADEKQKHEKELRKAYLKANENSHHFGQSQSVF